MLVSWTREPLDARLHRNWVHSIPYNKYEQPGRDVHEGLTGYIVPCKATGQYALDHCYSHYRDSGRTDSRTSNNFFTRAMISLHEILDCGPYIPPGLTNGQVLCHSG